MFMYEMLLLNELEVIWNAIKNNTITVDRQNLTQGVDHMKKRFEGSGEGWAC